jgi:hypothetical protein
MTAQRASTLLAALPHVRIAWRASTLLPQGRAAQRRVRIVLHKARRQRAVVLAQAVCATLGTVALPAPALSALQTHTRRQQEAKLALCAQGTPFLPLEARHRAAALA